MPCLKRAIIVFIIVFPLFNGGSIFLDQRYQTLLLSQLLEMFASIQFQLVLSSLLLMVACDNYCGSYNCYELLGVARDADQNTIKKAFRDMAKRYHPDKNRQEDTTQLFQMINKAYETLIDEKARFKYNLHLQNPEQSDYYHEYKYYSKKFIQDPQIHPGLVVSAVLILISTLQYIMRKQMYERARLEITQSHDFKVKLNQRCGNDKKKKEEVKEEMIQQISIDGGHSMPTYKDVLLFKIIYLPITIAFAVYGWARWIFKYYIKRQDYTLEDKIWLTIKAIQISPRKWQYIDESQKNVLIQKKLWIKQNKQVYEKEQTEKWLEGLKASNPRKYQMALKYIKKNQ